MKSIRAVVFGIVLVVALACGDKQSASEKTTATMTIGQERAELSVTGECKLGLNESLYGSSGGPVSGTSKGAQIELKSKSGYAVTVTLLGFTFGENRTYTEAIKQGDVGSQVVFNTPKASYSTALGPANASAGCVVKLQYSGSTFQVSCTDVAGVAGDKASMLVTGSCN